MEGQKVGGRATGRRGTEVGTGDRETEDPDQVRRVELRARVTDRENNKQDRRSGAGDAERPWERGTGDTDQSQVPVHIRKTCTLLPFLGLWDYSPLDIILLFPP